MQQAISALVYFFLLVNVVIESLRDTEINTIQSKPKKSEEEGPKESIEIAINIPAAVNVPCGRN